MTAVAQLEAAVHRLEGRQDAVNVTYRRAITAGDRPAMARCQRALRRLDLAIGRLFAAEMTARRAS